MQIVRLSDCQIPAGQWRTPHTDCLTNVYYCWQVWTRDAVVSWGRWPKHSRDPDVEEGNQVLRWIRMGSPASLQSSSCEKFPTMSLFLLEICFDTYTHTHTLSLSIYLSIYLNPFLFRRISTSYFIKVRLLICRQIKRQFSKCNLATRSLIWHRYSLSTRCRTKTNFSTTPRRRPTLAFKTVQALVTLTWLSWRWFSYEYHSLSHWLWLSWRWLSYHSLLFITINKW